MSQPVITKVEFVNHDDVENRMIHFTLSNGTMVEAEACYEGWQQWGGTKAELQITMPIVERHNDWLHGAGLAEPAD